LTEAQKAWLEANPDYRPIGVAPGMARWTGRGTLKADGTFVAATRRDPVPEVADTSGAFGVGKLTMQAEPGRSVSADDPSLLTARAAPGLRRGAKRIGDEPEPEAEAPKDPRGYVADWQKGGGGLKRQQ
jgi:hypothetical protein